MTTPSKVEQKVMRYWPSDDSVGSLSLVCLSSDVESLETELAVTRRALELMVQGVIEEVNDNRSTLKLVQRAVILAMEAARKEYGQ